MKKWLAITTIVSTLFLLIILGLGYLLKNNELETTRLKAQLLAESQVKPAVKRPEVIIEFVENSTEETLDLAIQKTILENLTCSDHAQCKVILLPESLACFTAINVIGVSIVNKMINEKNIDVCLSNTQQSSAQCSHNICQIQ